MERHKTLSIKFDQEDTLIDVLTSIKKDNNNQWEYEKVKTKDYAENIFLDIKKVACFKAKSTKLFKSTVWIVIDKCELTITNIVPTINSELSISEYNSVFDSFCAFIDSFFKEMNIQMDITDENVLITSIANDKTAEKLIIWEKNCNHDNPISHSLDEKRWFDFIITALKTDSKLTPDDLREWLVEEKKWDDSNSCLVDKVVSKYEYGLSILEYYINKYEEK